MVRIPALLHCVLESSVFKMFSVFPMCDSRPAVERKLRFHFSLALYERGGKLQP